MTKSRNEQTANHEAGHAVACITQLRAFRYVTILADEDSLGQLRHRAGRFRGLRPDTGTGYPSRTRIEQEIIVCLAGACAVGELLGKHRLRSAKGADEDFSLVANLAVYMTGSNEEANAYVAWLGERTANLITLPDNWLAVITIASALLEHKRLT